MNKTELSKSDPGGSSVHVPSTSWGEQYRRKAASEIPPANLVPIIDNLEAEVIKAGLEGPTPAQVDAENAEAKHSGIMVCLYPPTEVQDALAVEGGEAKQELHITLCYIKDHKGDTDAVRITEALKSVASDFAPVLGAVGGIGRFSGSLSSDGKDVYYASFDSPIIAALQQAVVEAIEKSGLQISRLHGYTPHITLKYIDQTEATPAGTKASAPFLMPKLSVVSSTFKGEVPFSGTRVLKYSPEFNQLETGNPKVPAVAPFTPRPQSELSQAMPDADGFIIAALRDIEDDGDEDDVAKDADTQAQERETALEHAAIRSGAKEKIKSEPEEKKKPEKKKPKVKKGLTADRLKKGYRKPIKGPADNMVGVSVGKEWKKEFVLPVHKEAQKQCVFKGMNQMRQIVYGVVLAPDEIDEQEDYMRADEIEKSAHDYLRNSRTVGRRHSGTMDAEVVESYIAPQDLTFPEGPHGPQMVKKGSWVLGVKVHDPKEWNKVINGDYQAFSVGGFGVRS